MELVEFFDVREIEAMMLYGRAPEGELCKECGVTVRMVGSHRCHRCEDG